MSEKAEIWNLTETSEKQRLMRQISRLPPGLYTVLIRAKRPTRTLDQNAYMHVAFVEPFRDWIEEHWGELVTHEQAFETLKLAVLGADVVGGIQVMPSTRKMDVAEFSAFLEKATEFLATKCDIATIPSDLFYEMKGSR